MDATVFWRWIDLTAADVAREAARLTELDSAIGDADHGSNLSRGFAAALDAVRREHPDTPGAVLTLAGQTLVSSVGGASGPLYGTLLRRTGKTLGEAPEVGLGELAAALGAGVEAVARLGGAAAGDKTMLDALLPAVEALPQGPDTAARAAAEGARATVPMRARKGRASYLGERSVGHEDPGAASSALLLAALARAVRDE
ncbi:dihydroxyacetone kinase subunit L [Streptomyces sp. JJ66]|uniref:dihydroxyacetone kinase subunit DhaL n=1 Tax=Streptomyces sp. JJ66 TaxID=2803843 RepID=UPI001C583705|nr:dihydroxyacetone kinase subunit DhaL [Streptomyces sp. JJ66]MBW1602111.1 dihydroxyacetone kinase subunit L [Streptomyces sp. JJ66]